MEITKVLAEIQRKLEAPKGNFNRFGKYHYRSAEDILDALKHALPAGAAVTLDDEIVPVADRIYVRATASLLVGADKICVSSYAREPDDKKGMDDCQITGSASSYARKYALGGLFAIDDAKDSDSTNDHGKPQEKKQEQKAEPKKADDEKSVVLSHLRKICSSPSGKAAVLDAAAQEGCSSLSDLPNWSAEILVRIRDAANSAETGM